MSEELLGAPPVGWRYIQLAKLQVRGGIQGGPFGSQLHARDYVSHGVPLIMPKNIGENRLSVTGHDYVTPEDAHRLAVHRVKVGDIVVGRKGDLSRRALIREDEEGWLCGTDCIRIRVEPALISSEYLSYYLGTRNVSDWLHRYDTGSTLPSLNTGNLGQLPVMLSPLRDQERIADVLRTLDDRIFFNYRQAQCCISLADAIFDRFRAKSFSWPHASFGAIAHIYGGGTPSTKEPSFWEGDIYWATPTDVTRLSLPYLFSTVRRITDAGLRACASQLYPRGSILMTSRATIGAFAIPSIPVAVNQGFIVVVPKREDDRWYLFHEMKSRVSDMIAVANGSTFLEISRGNFRALSVPVPSDQELREFHNLVDPLHDRARSASRESASLGELRDALLPRLMSGEIRIRDAERVVEEVT